MFISYAQNFEDVILWRALKHIEKGFYVDIGAQDPVIDSISMGFYEKGWRGIHVEPTAAYTQKLRANRPDEQIFQVAIGKGGEALSFFEIPETGLSTGDRGIAEEHREHGFTVRETEVPLLPLAKLFDDIGEQEVHWLKIDVEGMEKSVLESWWPSKKRPWIVVMESTRPLSTQTAFEEWEHILDSMNYKFLYFDGLNRFYLSEEHLELEVHFGAGPNIFDDFSVSGLASSPVANFMKQQNIDLQILNDSLRKSNSDLREKNLSATEMNIEAQKSVDNLSIAIYEMDKKYKDIKTAFENASSMVDKLQEQLAEVHSSSSWRLTYPLRVLSKIFRR